MIQIVYLLKIINVNIVEMVILPLKEFENDKSLLLLYYEMKQMILYVFGMKYSVDWESIEEHC